MKLLVLTVSVLVLEIYYMYSTEAFFLNSKSSVLADVQAIKTKITEVDSALARINAEALKTRESMKCIFILIFG